MNQESNWTDYYRITANDPPTKILVEGLSYLKNKGEALELGAGTPKDAKFLIANGFAVTAVDKEDQAKSLFEKIGSDKKLDFVQSSFEEFNYPDSYYDLVSAQRALPFLKNKKLLVRCFNDIKRTLKTGGLFVGHFFGPHDTWCRENKEMAFVDRSEIEKLLEGLEIIKLSETEEDSSTANGTPHHWHVFGVIARKI